MSESDRFKDNKDGTLTDTQTTLTWFLEDGWQREAKWFTWDEAHDLAIDINNLKFCSFQDWRLPLEDEIRTLYNPEVINHDKYEKENHLDTVFPPGGQSTVWLKGEGGSYGTLFDFKNGEVRPIYKSKSGRMTVRFVRGQLPNA
jgi:hypothetical protein